MNLKRAFSILLLAAFIMPGIVMAQTPDSFTALFVVEKQFTDDNPGSVDVTITCNVGTPLTQSATITERFGAVFTVNDMLDGPDFFCEIVEDGETGYSAKYWANTEPGGSAQSKTSCYYMGFGNGIPMAIEINGDNDAAYIEEKNACFIENQPDYVAVTVNKTWDLEGAGGDAVDTFSQVNVRSGGKIKDADRCSNNRDRWCTTLYFDGNDSETILVRPAYDGIKVTLNEKLIDSSVEATNDCGGEVWVYPADGASCTFENTVFFEGIPTLSQYGMVIMALLMLGVGFVGFRRFV